MAGCIEQMRGNLSSLDIGNKTFWAIGLLAEVRWLLGFGMGQVFVRKIVSHIDEYLSSLVPH